MDVSLIFGDLSAFGLWSTETMLYYAKVRIYVHHTHQLIFGPIVDAHTGTESDNFSIFLFRPAFALPSFSHSIYMIKPVEVRGH
jgi:hypothetical protein